MNEQQDYEQRFNDYCAKIVGLKTGSGCTDQIYFRDDGMHGTYECKIEDYVPYTSLDQLEEVVEVLKSTLGFTVDLEEQNRDGKLAAYRSMVDNIGDDCDDCNDHHDETVDDRVEDIKHKLVNGQCVKVMGWTRGTVSATENIYFDEGGNIVADVETYDPYNNIAYMEPVIDSLISGLGLRLDTGIVQVGGILAASRQLILDNIVTEELNEMIESFVPEEDVLNVEEGWDEYDRLEMTHPMYDDKIQEWIEENTKRQFEHSLQLNIGYNDTPDCDGEIIEDKVMKKLDDILKGFNLTDTWDDGTKQYSTKDMCHVVYDYFEVHHMTVYPNDSIDLSVDINCDLIERADDLEQYHVYKLTEIA